MISSLFGRMTFAEILLIKKITFLNKIEILICKVKSSKSVSAAAKCTSAEADGKVQYEAFTLVYPLISDQEKEREESEVIIKKVLPTLRKEKKEQLGISCFVSLI